MKYWSILGICLFLCLSACTNEVVKVPQEQRKVKIPAFSADNAYRFVEDQLAFGPRTPNSDGAKKAIQWMKNTLASYGWKTQLQEFDATLFNGQKVTGTNVIARHNPEVQERVLLCAHWDTRFIADKDSVRKEEAIPGANDGGSGVAVLMEIARIIGEQPIPMGVDIVLFDLEDQGEEGNNEYSWGLGSQYWAQNLHETPYQVKYGILLDMVGAKDATFYKEGFSMQYASFAVNKVWSVAQMLNQQKYFINRSMRGGITDDHKFIIEYARIPVIDVIDYRETSFMPEHHTHADDISIIDSKTLGAVGQVVLATLIKESNGEI